MFIENLRISYDFPRKSQDFLRFSLLGGVWGHGGGIRVAEAFLWCFGAFGGQKPGKQKVKSTDQSDHV